MPNDGYETLLSFLRLFRNSPNNKVTSTAATFYFNRLVKYFIDRSKAVLLCGSFMFLSVLCLLCLYGRVFICALWSPAGKGLTLCCLTVSLSLFHWYPGSGVVLDCIDSWSLHPYLLMSSRSFMILYIITSWSLVLLDSSVSQFRSSRLSVTLLVLWYLLVQYLFDLLRTISSFCLDWGVLRTQNWGTQEFLAIRRAISLNETYVLFCWNNDWRN